MPETQISKLRKHYNALLSERERIEPTWRELADNFLPLKRVMLQENNNPEDVYNLMGTVNNFILDATPVKGIRTLGAGMQSGMTSPAKRWFKLGLPDAKTEELPSVKEWLSKAQESLFNTMARSNFYNSTHRCYLEVGVFGTLVFLILEDDEKTIRTLSLSAGTYVISTNFKGIVDTLYRQIFMTAEQMVNQFGEENVSLSVKNAFKSMATKNQWFSVIHAIFPNENADSTKDDFTSMAYSSVYFEEFTTDNDKENGLSAGGFRERPFIAARWDVTGESSYGDSPAMDVLPFAKGLQAMKTTLLKVKQKNADPPLNVPPNMKSVSTAPGALNYMKTAGEKIEATVNVRGETADTQESILDERQQILQGLFNDVFRALALSPSDKMTATEVLERVSEGLRLLGPVLERLQFEMLDPIIDRLFAISLRNGLFPPVPAELEGAELRTEYISPLAQAQKAVGADAFNQLLTFAQAMAVLNPAVLDNIDFDEAFKAYVNLIGISPIVLQDDDTVERLRELERLRREAALRQETQSRDAEDLKTMSETRVTSDTNAIEAAAAASEAA
jgi:hypothetical protein